jgi:hypothetical protein
MLRVTLGLRSWHGLERPISQANPTAEKPDNPMKLTQLRSALVLGATLTAITSSAYGQASLAVDFQSTLVSQSNALSLPVKAAFSMSL